MIGKDLLSLVCEEDAAATAESLGRAFEQETQTISHGLSALRQDGSLIELELQGMRGTYLGRPAFIGMVQEISGTTRARS